MQQAQVQSTETDSNKKHIVPGLAAAFLIYAESLRASLPPSLNQMMGRETMASLSDPSVLLLKPAMRELQKRFDIMGDKGQPLFAETVRAIRMSLQSGLNIVFLIGAGTMLLAFLLILAIPEISIDVEVKDEKVPELVGHDLTAG